MQSHDNDLLLADDDIELCQLITQYLATEGFKVTSVQDGESALSAIKSNSLYKLIILDVMLPKLSGFEVLAQLRQHYKIPILMLTARGDDIDKIVGLEMGADDYLAKPCNPRELVARIRAILRRSNKIEASPSDILSVGDLSLHLGHHQALLSGREITLTSTEFSILTALLKHAGKLVTKQQLNETGLGRKLSAFDRSLDMHVSNLRKKLGVHANGKVRIKTIRSMGYQYILP